MGSVRGAAQVHQRNEGVTRAGDGSAESGGLSIGLVYATSHHDAERNDAVNGGAECRGFIYAPCHSDVAGSKHVRASSIADGVKRRCGISTGTSMMACVAR